MSKTVVIRYSHVKTGYIGYVSDPSKKEVLHFGSLEEAETYLLENQEKLPNHGQPNAIAYEPAEVFMRLKAKADPVPKTPEPTETAEVEADAVESKAIPEEKPKAQPKEKPKTVKA